MTTLLYIYARNILPDKADKLFKEMNNLGLKPDVAAYTSLINAHYKARNLKKCWDLWFDVRMGESTTPPDENIFGLMIEICAHVIKIILYQVDS